jgi:hypothetical protein
MTLLTLETYSDDTEILSQIDRFIQSWVGQNIEIKIVNIDDVKTKLLGQIVHAKEHIIEVKICKISSIGITKDTFTFGKLSLSGFAKLSLDTTANELIVYLPKVEIVDDPYTEPKPRSLDSRTSYVFKPI